MGKILICDDTLFMRHMLKNILESGGHEVIGEATNGQEAIEQYRSLNPDLVTMDITMPELDGVNALAKIKELDPKAKVIMVSAMGQEAMVKEAILKGARDFIIKPFKEGRVLYSVEKVLEDRPLGNMLY